jgi:hypothetical protein
MAIPKTYEGLLKEYNNFQNEIQKIKFENDKLSRNLNFAVEENEILQKEIILMKSEHKFEIDRMQRELDSAQIELVSKAKINGDLDRDDFFEPNIVKENFEFPKHRKNNYSKSFLNIYDEKDKLKEEFLIGAIADKTKTYVEDLNRTSFINKMDTLNVDTFDDKNKTFLDENYLCKNNSIKNLKASGIFDNDLYDDEDMGFIKQKIDYELQIILENRRQFVLNTLTQENFSFDIFKASKTTSDNTGKKSGPKNKMLQTIDQLVLKLQDRKQKVLNEKKSFHSQLEKVGIKFEY